MNFNPLYLPKADVVFTVMFLNKELCEKTLEIVLGEHIELIDINAESRNNLNKADHNSIYFDIKTQAVDGRIITLDLQRKYKKNRVRNRTVYYACGEIFTQTVEKGEYENLKNVVVSFILTEASLKSTTNNSKILLKNDATGEVYSDLLTIHEINIKHINNANRLELQILRDFFEIDNQEKFDAFVKNHGHHPYGKSLLTNYQVATSDVSILDTLNKEARFSMRLTEEERIEAEEKGLKEGLKEGEKKKAIEIAKNLLDILTVETIAKKTGLSIDEIKDLEK